MADEQFVLRVPPALGERLRAMLRGEAEGSAEVPEVGLRFGQDAGGAVELSVGEERWDGAVQDLPTVVESWKTYDGTHLVKSADIGQVIVIRDAAGRPMPPAGNEARDGITPPMHDARRRRFRPKPRIPPEVVSNAEQQLLQIMHHGTNKDPDVEVVEQLEDVEEPDEDAEVTPMKEG
eukprot:jgi/Chlat1/3534/Chrsp23S03711